ncbi:MAG: LacI family DNA-binding transcriptional regulator [Candidatus Izimaplasma sp.]|nr:LacI family DNA-binding transcriptional regulator [Candidatus Izimaplasma bacterium]
MTNIKDVAKKAGCGIATVSRVINNSGYVKKETREKIEKVIKEINYVPNEIARSMTRQRNDIVAFILPNTTHLFFGELLFHVEEQLFNYGYKVMICNSSEKLEKELAYLDMLKNNRVDAIILLTNNDIEEYLDKSLPLISFDRKFKDVPYVASDNYSGGELAAKKLIELGCKKLMFIGDDAQGELSPVNTDVTKRRLGFSDYLRKQGIEKIVNIEYPLGDYTNIPDTVHEVLNKHTEIDGIFTISDAVACDVVKELEKNGRRVPEDVKVIGFDGGRSFLNLGKKITSIGQSPQKIALAIAESVVSYYKKEEVKNKIIPIYFQNGETA